MTLRCRLILGGGNVMVNVKTKSDISFVVRDHIVNDEEDKWIYYIIYKSPWPLMGILKPTSSNTGICVDLAATILDSPTHFGIVSKTPDGTPYSENNQYDIMDEDRLRTLMELGPGDILDEFKNAAIPTSEILDDFELAYYPVSE